MRSSARTATEVLEQARAARSADQLNERVTACEACPRLVRWLEEVSIEKRAAYKADAYWGAPVPSFGASNPRILIVGLAPGAHGANRTGRMFTGDRSGDWLFGSLHRSGLATLPTSTSQADGQELAGTRITAAVRCAPPENKPTTEERNTCAPWLEREVDLVSGTLEVVIALGSFAWGASLRALAGCGWNLPSPRPRFGHGVRVVLAGPTRSEVLLIGSYHPSQQNTFTGRLTVQMLDSIFLAALGE